ncbi:MAG: hypothetical protein QNJ81_11670 [Acidimicrobiia bacterium]|nr:hypothetical protein [Acidimicrobiia bacterium]
MIEPQNTMLPVAAEPTPVAAPQGEAGFGEMLAQTLGMIPQVDPNAIRGILGDAGDQEGDSGDFAGGAESGELGEGDVPGRHVAISGNVPVRATDPAVVTRPAVIDTRVVGPVFSRDEASVPVTPQPAAPLAGDGIRPPVLAGAEEATIVPASTLSSAAAKTNPDSAGAVPAFAPAPSPDGRATTAPLDSAQPSALGHSAGDLRPTAEPTAGSGLPGDPARVANPPQNEAVPAADTAARESVRLVEPRSIPVGSGPVQVDSGNASGVTTFAVSGSEAAQAPSSPITHVAAPAAPAQHSALAERVLQAVELQANQPPPRTMVVDIPEIEGLRLVVSVRAGAEVHVVPASASTGGDGLETFLEELQGVLEHRGFVMTGDGRRRGANPNQDDQDEPRSEPRSSFRRPQPTDNDLRI